jgi:predicted enzyme related to lactoylglutathione lyase
MFTHANYLMVNVSDMGRSVAFYRDTLGLPLKFESPGWTEFATGTTTLALHLAPCPEAKPAAASGPQAGSCSFGFSVDDIDATWKSLQARGTRFVMPPTLREEEGIHLAVFLDPDGMSISLAQTVAHAQPQT